MNSLIEFRQKVVDFFECDKANWLYRALFIVLVSTFVFAGSSTVRMTAPILFSGFVSDWYNWLGDVGIYLIILFCFLTKKFSRYEFKVYFLLFVLSLLHGQLAAFRWQMMYFLGAALLVKDEKLKSAAALLFWVYIANFIVVISLNALSVIEPMTRVTRGAMRTSLGFVHPNWTGSVLLVIFLLYLLKQKNQISLLVLIASVPLYLLSMHWTDSTTVLVVITFIVSGILISMFFEGRRIKLLHFNKNTLVILLPFLFLTNSYLLAYFFNSSNSIIELLNRLVTGRIGLAHGFVHRYPITIWGTHVYINNGNVESMAIHGYRFLDDGFLFSLLNDGIIMTILRLFYISWFGDKLIKVGYKYVPIIITGVLLFGFMEILIWFPFWNILFLFGGILLKQTECQGESELIIEGRD